MQPKHPPGPPMTLGNMRETYYRLRGAHDVAEARFLKRSMRIINLGRAPRRARRIWGL